MHLSLLILLLIFGGAILAGVLGALVGLGGGILIVPLLTLAFGLPIHYAIGVSIVAVIATSSGAAAAYVRDHLTNLRIGLFLEIGTTIGAITGAFLAGLLAAASLLRVAEHEAPLADAAQAKEEPRARLSDLPGAAAGNDRCRDENYREQRRAHHPGPHGE